MSAPRRGFIYVMTNSSMPGQVKIGYTEKHPDERASELFTTSVGTPFHVDAIWHSTDVKSDELRIHQALEKYRVSPNREFFNLPPKEALNRIEVQLREKPFFTSFDSDSSTETTERDEKKNEEIRWEEVLALHNQAVELFDSGKDVMKVVEILESISAEYWLAARNLALIYERGRPPIAKKAVINVPPQHLTASDQKSIQNRNKSLFIPGAQAL